MNLEAFKKFVCADIHPLAAMPCRQQPFSMVQISNSNGIVSLNLQKSSNLCITSMLKSTWVCIIPSKTGILTISI